MIPFPFHSLHHNINVCISIFLVSLLNIFLNHKLCYTIAKKSQYPEFSLNFSLSIVYWIYFKTFVRSVSLLVSLVSWIFSLIFLIQKERRKNKMNFFLQFEIRNELIIRSFHYGKLFSNSFGKLWKKYWRNFTYWKRNNNNNKRRKKMWNSSFIDFPNII